MKMPTVKPTPIGPLPKGTVSALGAELFADFEAAKNVQFTEKLKAIADLLALVVASEVQRQNKTLGAKLSVILSLPASINHVGILARETGKKLVVALASVKKQD